MVTLVRDAVADGKHLAHLGNLGFGVEILDLALQVNHIDVDINSHSLLLRRALVRSASRVQERLQGQNGAADEDRRRKVNEPEMPDSVESPRVVRG